jgi:hypothetical protein
MEKFIYTGPSWGELSYEPMENNDVWPNYTNLALEWDIPCYNLAKRANNNYQCIDSIQALNKDLPVVWVLCEPLVAILHNGPLQHEYLQSKDHLAFRQELLQQQLTAMNDLGLSIGIVGAHSDIRQSDIDNFSNLSIIHPSWQNFLANQVGVQSRDYNWGYEIAHVMFRVFPEVKPTDQLVMDMYEGLDFWERLEKEKVFCDVHPNKLGNIKFAKYIKEKVIKFVSR